MAASHRPMLANPSPNEAEVRELAAQLRRIAGTLDRQAGRIAAGSAHPDRLPALAARLHQATRLASAWRCEATTPHRCGLPLGHRGPHVPPDTATDLGICADDQETTTP